MDASGIIVIALIVIGLLAKISKKPNKAQDKGSAAQKPGQPIVPYKAPGSPEGVPPVSEKPQAMQQPKKSKVEAFTDILRELDIEVPDIPGVTPPKAAKPAAAKTSAAKAAGARPGHEGHDPTEGSMELLSRSPEGESRAQHARRPGHKKHDPTEGSIEISGRSPEGAGEKTRRSMDLRKPAAPVAPKAALSFDAAGMRNAVIMSEILSKPVALRRRGQRY